MFDHNDNEQSSWCPHERYVQRSMVTLAYPYLPNGCTVSLDFNGEPDFNVIADLVKNFQAVKDRELVRDILDRVHWLVEKEFTKQEVD